MMASSKKSGAVYGVFRERLVWNNALVKEQIVGFCVLWVISKIRGCTGFDTKIRHPVFHFWYRAAHLGRQAHKLSLTSRGSSSRPHSTISRQGYKKTFTWFVG
jgi:hypothetical protein